MDQEAFGENVEYTCVCDYVEGPRKTSSLPVDVLLGQRCCPFCLMNVFLDKRKFYPDPEVALSPYLFVDKKGLPVEKQATAENFKELAALANVAARPGTVFGGHSPRIIGARYYARKGLSVKQVMHAGRWKSEKTALRYIGNALSSLRMKEFRKKSFDAKLAKAMEKFGPAVPSKPPPAEACTAGKWLYATRGKRVHRWRGGCTTHCNKHLCSFIVVDEGFMAKKCIKCFGPEVD